VVKGIRVSGRRVTVGILVSGGSVVVVRIGFRVAEEVVVKGGTVVVLGIIWIGGGVVIITVGAVVLVMGIFVIGVSVIIGKTVVVGGIIVIGTLVIGVNVLNWLCSLVIGGLLSCTAAYEGYCSESNHIIPKNAKKPTTEKIKSFFVVLIPSRQINYIIYANSSISSRRINLTLVEPCSSLKRVRIFSGHLR